MKTTESEKEMQITLKDMRIRRGWSQVELSERSGVPQPMISEIETGSVKAPQVPTLYALARALRCTVDDLIQEEKEA